MRAPRYRATRGGAPRRGMLAAAPAILLVAVACADPSTAPRDPDVPLRALRAAKAAVPAGERTDGYIVFLKASPAGAVRAARTADVSALAKVAGAARVQPLSFVPGFVARGAVDVAALRADPRVARVARNPRYFKLASVTDALAAAGATTASTFATNATFWRRGWQWNLKQIGADRATATGAGRIACIVDAGINTTHQDLRGKVVVARAFPGDVPFGPEDGDLDHGSYVASIVTSNGIGIASVAPGARLMSANVFGPGGTSGAQIIDAIAWCSQNGADVINISIDGAQTRGTPAWVEDSTTLSDAVQAARARGTVVVGAAGNEGQAIPNDSAGGTEMPAEATGVIAVGATAPPGNTAFPFAVPAPAALYDQLAGYSTYNSGRDDLGSGVRLYAPGGAAFANRAQLDVLGVCSSKAGPACSTNDRYSASAGSSASSPHVAGVVALIASRTNAPRSLARVRAIEACLLATADPLPAGPPFFGRGRVNAERATRGSCPGL